MRDHEARYEYAQEWLDIVKARAKIETVTNVPQADDLATDRQRCQELRAL